MVGANYRRRAHHRAGSWDLETRGKDARSVAVLGTAWHALSRAADAFRRWGTLVTCSFAFLLFFARSCLCGSPRTLASKDAVQFTGAYLGRQSDCAPAHRIFASHVQSKLLGAPANQVVRARRGGRDRMGHCFSARKRLLMDMSNGTLIDSSIVRVTAPRTRSSARV